MRSTSMFVATAWLAGTLWGCAEPCPGGELKFEDGSCPYTEDTDLDTDVVIETDSDTDEVIQAARALITLEWTISELPSDNKVELYCNGREIHTQDGFTARKKYIAEYEVTNGDVCVVTISDVRGGFLSPGRLLNCSAVVAEWEGKRSYSEVVATATVVGCVKGCPDPIAENYDPRANLDDGSCQYIYGCTDPEAFNFDPTATRDDESCDYGGFGVVELTVVTDNYPSDTTAAIRCDGYDVLREEDFTRPNSAYFFSVLVDAGFDCEVLIGDRVGDQGAGGSVSSCGQRLANWDYVTGTSHGGALGPYEESTVAWHMQPCSGCTNPASPAFDADALVDDGTCTL